MNPQAFFHRLDVRLALAGLSGIACGIVWATLADPDTVAELVLFYGLSGMTFGVGVLWPLLNADQSIVVRAVMLVLVSVISYWCAVQTAFGWDNQAFSPGVIALSLASIVGTAIIWAAVPVLSSVRPSWRYLVCGTIAAPVGGIVFYAMLDVPYLGFYGSYFGWHVTIALALFYASAGPSTPETAGE